MILDTDIVQHINGVIQIELKDRQKAILEIVRKHEPITSEAIASMLGLTRSALRADLSVLTMSGLLAAKPKIGYTVVEGAFRLSDPIGWREPVSRLKSHPVVVEEKTSVYDAIVTMFLEDVGTLFVLSDGLLSGVVSRKDFLKTAIGGTDIHKIPVGVVMTRMPNIVMVQGHETMLDAAQKIMEHQIDCLPVVEEDQETGGWRVTGRLSKTNITAQYVEMYGGEEV